MQLRNTFHNLLTFYEELYNHEKCINSTENQIVSKTIRLLCHRTLVQSRSISILFEAGLNEDLAILSRTLLETTIRVGHLVINKDESHARTSQFLVDNEYKARLKIDLINFKLFTSEMDSFLDEEKKELLELLKIEENELAQKKDLLKMAEELGLRQAYAMYYRYFSQYVHSKHYIFEMEDHQKYLRLGELSMLCCCTCWLHLIDYINHFYDLKKDKKIKQLFKDLKRLLDYKFRDFGYCEETKKSPN